MNKYYQMLRRRFYIYFRRKYVSASIAKRKGKCNHCSCCEVIVFGRKYNCKYFEKKTKICQVYNTDKMPRPCCYYPFDEKDIWDEFKDRCGFYWEEL